MKTIFPADPHGSRRADLCRIVPRESSRAPSRFGGVFNLPEILFTRYFKFVSNSMNSLNTHGRFIPEDLTQP